MTAPLILSLFPGIGLLDRAFEVEGFTVVRGPDQLWGGDVRAFTPPPNVFTGVIGGPPCPSHSSLRAIIRAKGHSPAPDLVPEYLRIVAAAQPEWWLMECTPLITDAAVAGYQVHRFLLNNRWIGDGMGGEQSRKRVFQFGSRTGARLIIEMAALEPTQFEYCCTASEGRRGGRPMMPQKNKRGFRQTMPHREFKRFCELQGLPGDFLAKAPMTKEGRYRMVGNGVPIPMGRALARGVQRALREHLAR